MLTMSINNSFEGMLTQSDIDQYMTAQKYGGSQAEYASMWLLKKLEKASEGRDVISLPWFARGYQASDLKRERKNEVPILSEGESEDGVGISDNYLADPSSGLDFTDVEKDIVREGLLNDWSKLVKVVSILEGIDLVSLFHQFVRDKESHCCGRIQKRIVVYPSGKTEFHRFTKQEQLDEFNKKMKNSEAIVTVCSCKNDKAKRRELMKKLRAEYKIDGLLVAIMFDPTAFNYCFNTFDKFSPCVELNDATLEELVEIKNTGFGGVDYM